MELVRNAQRHTRVKGRGSEFSIAIFKRGRIPRRELASDALRFRPMLQIGATVEAAMAEVLKRFGQIDALHNNAGIATPSLPQRSRLGSSAVRECEVGLLDDTVCISGAGGDEGCTGNAPDTAKS